ncbi:cholest-4-en-3-one 26-monooxygenase [Pseudomonas sp. JAI111]|uniref:cytochrome P450 n=1 Tax=Pseudomonas sp. JAI111 TaxID=2735913 RepID=UPI002169FE6D|nr:cytochrome P450 [Pseudomonas sp. JAI111]MCS3835697.1 cholest-4-en-3-one 26-monooxygenase [Pseudomonas sp. JAI111]
MHLDLVDPATFAEGPPHTYFDYLRAQDPCHLQDDPRGGKLWSLTRHADIRALSMDKERFTSAFGFLYPNVPAGTRGEDNLMFTDGPRHARLRSFLAGSFSPRVVAQFDHWIREICVAIVSKVKTVGSFDAIAEIAAELPAQVIASILGVPNEDRHNIVTWATALFGRMDPEIGIQGYMAARTQVEAYALELRELKRKQPGADMATELMLATAADGPITDGEYQQSVYSLMIAGFETTHTLIAQSLLLMASDPDVQRQVDEAPRESLREVIDEFLRVVSPVNHMGRTALQDVEIHGKQIKKGDFVMMWYAAGNRDPEVYQDPHRYNYRRDRKGHIAFGGGGAHFCIGAHLARLEVEILLDEFRKAGLKLELDGAPQRAIDVAINAIRRLPMKAV